MTNLDVGGALFPFKSNGGSKFEIFNVPKVSKMTGNSVVEWKWMKLT